MRAILILALLASAAHAADAPKPYPKYPVQRVAGGKTSTFDNIRAVPAGAQPITATHVPNYFWWLQNGKKK